MGDTDCHNIISNVKSCWMILIALVQTSETQIIEPMLTNLAHCTLWQEPAFDRNGKLLNPLSRQDISVLLQKVIPSGKMEVYNSMEMEYEHIPDGKVALLAYPLESRKYYGGNPQVIVIQHHT